MDRKTQQILTAVVILASVTALSFGIKQVRVIVHRARTAQQPVSNDAGSEQSSANESAASARNTQEHDTPLEDQQTPDAITGRQEALAEADNQENSEQTDPQKHSGEHANAVATGKSFKGGYLMSKGDFAKSKDVYLKSKGDYAKYEGSKGLQKISVGEHETLYITGEGERWYVAENPDGTVTKTQMQEVDGELQPVGETNTYPSGGGKGNSEADGGK